MKKLSELTLQDLGQLSAICLITATLTACGGGGSAGGDAGEGGGQGLLGGGGGNETPVDSDGDGLSDANEDIQGSDPFLQDTDGDGFNDLEEWNALTNPNLADTDGDGTNDDVDIAPTDALVGGTAAVADRCDDPNSDNQEWGDNCILKNGGTYAISSYTKGVQRILWCQGFDAGQDINTFADGNFGPNTEQAVRDFQTANSLLVDGIVGPETWPRLFSKLSLISSETDYDVHTITGTNCTDNARQFYQLADGVTLLGWKMAQFPNSTQLVDFGSQP